MVEDNKGVLPTDASSYSSRFRESKKLTLLLLLPGLLLASLFLLFCINMRSAAVEVWNYESIQKGMTASQVRAICGNPEKKTTVSGSGHLFFWDNSPLKGADYPSVDYILTYDCGVITTTVRYHVGIDHNGRVVAKEIIERTPF